MSYGAHSKWGNPFKIGRDGSRAEVIAKFRQLLCDTPKLAEDAKRELRGLTFCCNALPN
jgi:Domain of unknown function (DUF4326)